MDLIKYNIEKIIKALDDAEKSFITVFGDFSLDKYVFSKPSKDELSVETDLVAYQVHATASFPGIGGTVANNLRSLGANVICIGLVGNDGHGIELVRCLDDIGADTGLMVVSDHILTNTYLKPMRGEIKESSVEINRLDFRNYSETSRELEEALLINLEKALKRCKGVIITDQFLERNCSVVTDKVRDGIAELALKYKDVFFYADSRGYIGEFRNVIRKCNEHEIEKSNPGNEGNGLRFVTMGEKGIMIYNGNEKIHIPSFKATPPFDICGAGDATNAGIMLGLTLGLNIEEAALLGACAASITIEQIGVTGTATREQVKGRFLHENKQIFSEKM
ncbi:MAG TPA: PfkB family carbohydrate kinase [Anaerovoracaceae bacterium]|nr:PfkB family carbohydrate kinase [Anaerovoracaceae bacterium]